MTITREMLAEVMQDTWGEICDDAGAHPSDMEHGRGTVLFYRPSHWTRLIALRLKERLAADQAARTTTTEGGGDFDPALFGARVLDRMGGRTSRQVAPEIGISSATLNRVTRGNAPDLSTYFALCAWLDDEPVRVLDREHFARLHRLQHDGTPAAKPKLGASLTGWAADEITALRALASPRLTTPAVASADDYEKAYFERGMFAAYAWMVTKRRGEQLSDAVVDHAWDNRDAGMGPTECLPKRPGSFSPAVASAEVRAAIESAKEFVEAATTDGFDAADALDLIREFAALPPTETPDEAGGWIIANGAGDRWRCWSDFGSDWTDDREKATRYHRREDAEAVHAGDEDAWSVTPYRAALDLPAQATEVGHG